MDKLSVAVLLFCAGNVWAAGHTVDVRVSNGIAVFSQTEKLSVGQAANFVGPVSGGKSMIFNTLLDMDSGKPGEFKLQYQLELSGGRGSKSPTIQAQGTLRMRPGLSLIAVDCGSWTVELSLDKPGSLGKKKKSAAWDDSGLGNYRLTADLSRGSARQLCRVAVSPDSQFNVVDGFTRGQKKYGFIFNAMPVQAMAGVVKLQYQLEYTPVGMTSLQLQNQEALTLGRESRIPGQGYKLGLLVESGVPRAAPAAAAPLLH